jgi:hypothetical protein
LRCREKEKKMMTLTVKELIEHLQNFPDQEEEVVASIWGKEDIVYALEVMAECPEEYEVTEAQIEGADTLAIWEANKGMVQGILEHDAEYLNDEFFTFTLSALKGEDK